MVQWRFAGPGTELFSDFRAGPVASNQVSAGCLRSMDCDFVVVALGDIVDSLAPLQQDRYSVTATYMSARRTILPEHPNPTASNSSNAVAVT